MKAPILLVQGRTDGYTLAFSSYEIQQRINPQDYGGRDVVIWMDEDERDQVMARQTAQKLWANGSAPKTVKLVQSAAEVREGGEVVPNPNAFERRPLDWETLASDAPAAREWAVREWLPMGHVSLVSGRGGLGKTLLMQTMATCVAVGVDYIGDIVEPRRVLFWAGEDEHDELWRRQMAICRWINLPMAKLKDHLILESCHGRDITLAEQQFGVLNPSPMLKELRAQVGDYKADLVILDSTARIFGGNENDRHQVTKFISWIMGHCGKAGVCLIGHPAKGEGSEYSGSTAWEGSVRSRLYLGDKVPSKGSQGSEDAPLNTQDRFLSRRKANYAGQDWKKLVYDEGVLKPEFQSPAQAKIAASPEMGQAIVLRAFRSARALNMDPVMGPGSPNYLPKLATQFDWLEGLSQQQFGRRLNELVSAGKLKIVHIGRNENRTQKMALREAE